MKDVVVTPLWRRPEFFKVWVELIQKCTGADKLLYIFCLDYGYNTIHDELIQEFPFEYGVIRMPKTSFKLGKQSYNVLNGMLQAAGITNEYVFYIEEDIFPAKDFFPMHYEIHKQQPNIFCSIGTRCNNTDWKTTDDIGAYYLSPNPDYQSWGSCFKKTKINNYIKPHFNGEYFSNPNAYCKKLFDGSIVGDRFTEQDGLIRRIVEKTDLKIAYPHVPRAYHAGFYGYNRQGKGKHLGYDEKLKLVREVVFDYDKMREHCVNDGYFKDSQPVDLSVNSKEFKYVEAKT
jgi:hypothetical protein